MAKRQTPNAKRRIPGVILSVLGIAYCGWLLGLALAQPAANTPPPDFPPQVFEIARELRCPVCQGESVAESNAGISQEMRRIIAEQLAQGKNKEQIKAYFVSRYGPWILYEPPRLLGLALAQPAATDSPWQTGQRSSRAISKTWGGKSVPSTHLRAHET